MKYLEAKAMQAGLENKMQEGTRSDQHHDEGMSLQTMAIQLGVDITKVKGTGKAGAITKKDIREAAKAASAAVDAGDNITLAAKGQK